MEDLVQCVPNFSEGRDRAVIEQIVAAIASVDGVAVLDVDMGWSAHRTVVTFVGDEAAVQEAAFRGIQQACRTIDMRDHRGVHWRQGSTDVCPFVPLGRTTMAQCVRMARRVAQRVAEALQLPVYLYGEAAARAERRELRRVRRGGYEALRERLRVGRDPPDLGPTCLNERNGACAIGARALLVAYNVNLVGQDIALACDIARRVRSRGVRLRDDDGNPLHDAEGLAIRVPGLPHCRANGWVIEEYGCAQVTANLTNYRITGLHQLFQRVRELAEDRGGSVRGSEIVGLVPREALLAAGRHFSSDAQSDDSLLELAVKELGLNAVRPFELHRKLLEARIAGC